MTSLPMASSSVRYSLMETGNLWLFSLRKKSISKCSGAFGAGHEHEALEEVHVLLVLEQRAVERRDDGLAVLRAQRVRRNILGEQELQPVQQLGGRGLLLQARHLAHLEEDFHRLAQERFLQ